MSEMHHPAQLAEAWLAAKAKEAEAIAARREIEDQLRDYLGIAETDEGTETAQAGEYQIKATMRLNRKIDAAMAQEIAAKHGITNESLGKLFRWKPEIDAKNWKAAPEQITTLLSGAITSTASRPSFSITSTAN